jgi:hypothetical protein
MNMEYRESDGEGSIHSRTHEDEHGCVAQISFDEAVGRMGGTIDLVNSTAKALSGLFSIPRLGAR